MKLDNTEKEKQIGPVRFRPDPEDRQKTELGSPWGEPGPKDPEVHDQALEEAAHESSPAFLGQAFSGFGAAARAAQASVQDNPTIRGYESAAPLLRKQAAQGVDASTESLRDRLLRLSLL